MSDAGSTDGGGDDDGGVNVLWLRPTKPDNISVGRERVAEHLRERGHGVDVQDASGGDAFGAARTAIGGDYDVMVGTVRMGLYVGTLLSTALRTPFVADVTDPIEQIDALPTPLYRVLFAFEHVALGRADEAMFVYESSYRQAQRRGIDGEKVENGVDYERFADPDPDVVAAARAELATAGVDEDRPIAIYLGGLTPVYHVESILAAAASCEDVQFVFVGDGELSERVDRAAATTENVFSLGTYEYELMPGFLALADVGLCLVDAEQPLKVLEYGAAGLPVVGAHGELESRFDDDELLFVDPETGVVDGVRRLVDDPEAADRYGTNLSQRAEATRWTRIADRYERAIYRAIHD